MTAHPSRDSLPVAVGPCDQTLGHALLDQQQKDVMTSIPSKDRYRVAAQKGRIAIVLC